MLRANLDELCSAVGLLVGLDSLVEISSDDIQTGDRAVLEFVWKIVFVGGTLGNLLNRLEIVCH